MKDSSDRRGADAPPAEFQSFQTFKSFEDRPDYLDPRCSDNGLNGWNDLNYWNRSEATNHRS